MNIELILSDGAIKAVKELYGQDISPDIIQFQKTKKEFEGDITLVVFPFVKLARKSPEQTGEEIGNYLKSQFEIIEKFNVIKGFLNFSIGKSYWLNQLDEIHNKKNYGIIEAG
ncbi:MAG: arginyl-tRNA synthetase, partial [Bacteroidetes bacterium]|nr:arginyl-tRNA synthetase [Bacteroidota bacterium]